MLNCKVLYGRTPVKVIEQHGMLIFSRLIAAAAVLVISTSAVSVI
jgi:hypothetical protein